MAHIVADAIVRAHLKTMLRLDVDYDVLPRESEILHLKFWASAFELLKERKAIYFETEGKNKGLLGDARGGVLDRRGIGRQQSDRALERHGDVRRQGHRVSALEIRPARQGFLLPALLTLSRRARLVGHRPTTRRIRRAAFGRGATVYNVIDVRQSYLQDVVVAGCGRSASRSRRSSVHFSYEMVALSPRCVRDLGIELSEEDKRRPYVEVSGRKGLGVKADDLMDKLIERALEEVASAASGGAGQRNGARWPGRSPSARCAISC